MKKAVSRVNGSKVFGFDRDELDTELDKLVYVLQDLHGLARDIHRQGHPKERAARDAYNFAGELRDAVRSLEADGTVRGSLAAVARKAAAAAAPRQR